MKYSLNKKATLPDDFAQRMGLRDFAFLGMTWDICGLEVRIMTMRDLAILHSVNSPFVKNRNASFADAGVLLWLLSPEHTEDATAHHYWDGSRVLEMSKREAFMLKLAAVSVEELFDAIDDYIEFIFMDSPRGNSADTVPAVSLVVSTLNYLMEKYRWTMAAALNTPLPQIYQFYKDAENAKGDPHWDVRATGAYLRWINSLSEEERAPIMAAVDAGEEVDVPEQFV